MGEMARRAWLVVREDLEAEVAAGAATEEEEEEEGATATADVVATEDGPRGDTTITRCASSVTT